jgi:hypothetical protein
MKTNSTLAAELYISVNTLNRWRLEGVGPRYIKAGRRVLYDPNDVTAWLASNRRQSTSQIMGGRANG